MRFRLRTFVIFFILLCLDSVLYFNLKRTENESCEPSYIFNNLTNSKSAFITPVRKSTNKTLYADYNLFNMTATTIQPNSDPKTILFYAVPEYKNRYLRKDFQYTNCEYKNCIITYNRSKLLTADALVFYVGIRKERLGLEPPIQPEMRHPDQAWIFSSNEPPEHFYNMDFRAKSWQNTMNWSMLYRFDSDIPNPYGFLLRQHNPEKRDYEAIFNAKTRNALWMVSHCHVSSERRLYVNSMIKNGFSVDILGGCGPDGNRISNEDLERIIPTYRYYLAFENSFCHDYISEKYFANYNLSWIVVVRGGADYGNLLPENTYVNTADFSNVSSLTDHLIQLGNDREKYINMLREKDRYASIRWPANWNCEICRRLNNISKYRNVYGNIEEFLINNQCKRPNDF